MKDSILKIIKIRSSKFEVRSSMFDLGSGETCARPKVTGNITLKYAPLTDVNERFIIENYKD